MCEGILLGKSITMGEHMLYPALPFPRQKHYIEMAPKILPPTDAETIHLLWDGDDSDVGDI